MTRIFVHACCAHCLGKLLTGLEKERGSWDPVIYWYNPNIHPLIEYRRRLKAVKMLAERSGLPLVADESYGLVEFCRAVHGHEQVPERCIRCYRMRLQQTARAAREAGCTVFTTTLVTSRHQDHRLIRSAGEEAAGQERLFFLYRDARSDEADPDLVKMLYRQSYCGCVFSEYDRYQGTVTHLWPPREHPGKPAPQAASQGLSF